MSKSIANGNSVDLPMDAGKSIKLGWLGGTYSVKIVAGAASLPVALATNSAGDASFGPYANSVILRVSTSAVGRVEYDVATTPEFHPPGLSYVRQSDGVPVTLSGLGAAAAFAMDGGGSSAPGTPVTGSTTLPASALGTTTPVNSASATVQTLPPAAAAFAASPYGVNGLVVLYQMGVGTPTFAAGAGDTLRATAGVPTSVQYGNIAAMPISTTEWALA